MISKNNFWIIWGILTFITFTFMVFSLGIMCYKIFLEEGSIKGWEAIAYLFAECNSYIFYNLSYTLIAYYINFNLLKKK